MTTPTDDTRARSRRAALFAVSTFSALALALAAGCDRPEPVTYSVPKDEGAAPAAPAPAAPADGMRVLPGMAEGAEAAGAFDYEVPEGWEEYPPESGVRKANFRVPGPGGTGAEVTVTAFPGDVGGKLDNINRWRAQIGLEPIDLGGMSAVARPFVISDHQGMLVTLEGETESVLGGILGFHGHTWFFKMRGDAEVVAAQAGAMEIFLRSVTIEDHHH